ncbi:hypothetical protein Bca52824_051454 [Brassica carinata]|uniref:Uncharacterized protein n=1 Tax=Brassica carinata TaxID=52824 RepID=A0A8X7R0E6_BRACI|nr:hypothetical protein Bca52824_051454 [Brassica carinata]
MIADSDCIVLVEAEAEAEAEKYPDRRLRKEDTEAFEVEVRMDIPEKDTEIGSKWRKNCEIRMHTKHTTTCFISFQMPNREFPSCAPNDGLHFRQPWVMGVQQEIERLKQRFHEQEKLLRECEALKAKVKMLLQRVSELERVR